ncbi:MAG TPA: phosphorylase [Ruminococcus sp.]|nr:phosphorylase [Ruminococcus sp.]
MVTDSFDQVTEPVISPGDFHGEKHSLVKKCMILFSHELQSHLLSRFSCTKIAEIQNSCGVLPVWCMEYHGAQIAFYLSPPGSAAASDLCYEVHWLTGADTFYLFGSCGSLDGAKTKGRFIIPTESYRGDGASYYYAPPADYIAVRTSDTLAARFAERGIPYVQGRVWTTASMFRETRGLTAKRREEGCIAVEMELAGVQAVCDFYGLTLYCFLEAGDILAEGSYQPEGLDAANHGIVKLLTAMMLASEYDND